MTCLLILGMGADQRRREQRFGRWGWIRKEEVLCCQFKAKQSTRDSFLVGYLLACWLAGPLCQISLSSTKDLAGSFYQNLLLSDQDLEDKLQPQLQVPQLCQIDTTTTSSNQSNNTSTLQSWCPWNIYCIGGWGQVRGEETKDSGVGVRSEEKRCYAVSSKQSNWLEICF